LAFSIAFSMEIDHFMISDRDVLNLSVDFIFANGSGQQTFLTFRCNFYMQDRISVRTPLDKFKIRRGTKRLRAASRPGRGHGRYSPPAL
jgi:hypothetical protein